MRSVVDRNVVMRRMTVHLIQLLALVYYAPAPYRRTETENINRNRIMSAGVVAEIRTERPLNLGLKLARTVLPSIVS